MVKMGVNPESLKAPKPVSAGWYDLRLKGIQCKMSSSKKGYNYVAILEVVNNKAEFNGSPVFYQMNNGFSQGESMQDMSHGLGFPLENYQDSQGNTVSGFSGDWKLKDDTKPDDFDMAQYSGVLLGKTTNAELVTDSYDGRERNVVKQFKCKVPDCVTRFADIRHKTDLRGKKK